jgi:hypothetical protein
MSEQADRQGDRALTRGPEAKVKDEIREYLKSIGAYQFWPVQVGMGAATIDALVCWRGMFVGIEVKRPDTRPAPTPRQNRVLDEIASASGATVIAYCVDDVRARLKSLAHFSRDI